MPVTCGVPGEAAARAAWLAGAASALGVLVHCKGVYYDWVRTLKAALAFYDGNPQLAEPPGFSL